MLLQFQYLSLSTIIKSVKNKNWRVLQMKTKSKWMVLLLCFIMLVSACGNNSSTNTSEDESNGSASEVTSNGDEGPKEITFWHYFTSLNGEVTQRFIDEYNEQHEDVVINFEFVPREELVKQLSIGLVSGELPDMAFIDNPNQAAYSAMGLFADLTERFNNWEGNNFLDGVMESAKYDNKVYGLPHASNTLALFYDEDMLNEAGLEPPTTWDELSDAALKLTHDHVYGFAFSAVKSEEGTFQMLPYFLSSGASVNTISLPEGVRALSFLTDLVEQGVVSKEVLNWKQGDVEKQFIAGNAAMIVNGPWIVNSIRENAPDKNWGVTLLPKDKEYASALGGENIVILENSQVKDEAWDFLTWFMTKENNMEFVKEVGRFSPLADVSPEDIWADDPIMQVFAEEMKYARPRGPHPKWPEISTAIITAVQESLTGSKTPEDALQGAQERIDEINASLGQ